MDRKGQKIIMWLPLCILFGSLLMASAARAQDGLDNPPAQNINSSDGNNEEGVPVSSQVSADGASTSPDGQANASAGPVRLARFAYVHGNVTWRTDASSEWSPATVNLPLREGAQLWVSDGGRAEVQFDDGSLLRLGNGAIATLQTLYSDADGEFTEIKLTGGLATMAPRNDRSVYQIDTPVVSVKASGPASIRIGVDGGAEIAVHSGGATVEGSQGKITLQTGDYLDLANADAAYDVLPLPQPDSWDTWNTERDRRLQELEDGATRRYLPPNIDIVAGDLDAYGDWRHDSRYGEIWCPRVNEAGWRPYHDGHWTWVNPFGWTWVAAEPWGWAPYHYGTWVYEPYGWAWAPGPVNQYWCPAVVHFCESGGQVAWAPLAPAEVHYPTVPALGFGGANWSAYFSIGQCGVYYPTEANYCVGRPWNTQFVNHVTYVTHVTNVTNINGDSYAINHSAYLLSNHYVPINARNAPGASSVAAVSFGGQAAYRALATSNATLFAQGRVVSAPPAGRAPVAGPIVARPTPSALSPTRTFLTGVQPSGAVMSRPVYRAPVRPAILRASIPVLPSGVPATNRGGGFIGAGATFERPIHRPTGGNATTGTPGQGTRSPDGGVRSTLPNRNTAGGESVGAGVQTGRLYPGYKGAGGNTTTSADSAAEAARRARASLGLPSGTSHVSAGDSGSVGGGRTTNPSSPGAGNRAADANSGASSPQRYSPTRPYDPSRRDSTQPSSVVQPSYRPRNPVGNTTPVFSPRTPGGDITPGYHPRTVDPIRTGGPSAPSRGPSSGGNYHTAETTHHDPAPATGGGARRDHSSDSKSGGSDSSDHTNRH